MNESKAAGMARGTEADASKLAQELRQLRAERDRYFDLYERAPMGCFALTDQGAIMEANLTAARLLGAPRDLLLGQPLSASVLSEYQNLYRESQGRLAETGQPQLCDLRMRRQDGTSFWARLEMSPTPDGEQGLSQRVLATDITEFKVQELALRDSEERFQALASNTADWESWFGPDGTYRWVNPAVERFTGYTPAEILAMEDFPSILVAEEDLSEVLANFPILLQGGRGDGLEFRCRRKDGSQFWLSVSWEPIFDAKGNPLGVRTSGRDITERKRMEVALKESEERFRRLLQNVPTVAVQGYEMDGTTRYWNQASERLYGYREAEALGRDLRDLIIPPEMRETVSDAIQHMAETGQPSPSAELSLMRKDGSRVSVISSHAIVQVPGRPPELFCIDVDISERKAVEEAQHFLLTCGRAGSPEDFFLALAQYLAVTLKMDYVCIDRLMGDSLEAQTLAVFCDGAFEPKVSYTLKDTPCSNVVGKTICCFPRNVRGQFPKDDVLQQMLAESYVGTTLWSARGLPIGLIGVIGRQALEDSRLAEILLKLVAPRASAELERRDAETEQRRLEERVNQVQRLEALGFLSAGLSHNLNNVLAAILGLASTRELVLEDGKDRQAFRVIVKACERGREVLDSLLRFARPQLAVMVPVELNGILRELRSILDHTTRMRITITEVRSRGPLWIQGDTASLGHALMNLCINAVNAMPEGGGLTLRTTATPDGSAEVSVEDTGQGMTPEVLAHALEPFYTTKPTGESTGLGLSMTYGVVKAHGGSLDISSRVGQGTRVTLRFPLVPSPALLERQPVSSTNVRSLEVLLVDDDEFVRLSTVEMLETAGWRTLAASGGQEALDRLAAGLSPDIVLLDLNMPGLDGKDTLERIRQRYPELPVLIVSGQPGAEHWDCFRQPHTGVLPKPFSFQELLDRIALTAQWR